MTRLYPVYARDVLSFLDFSQLQQCRLVSRSINATIIANPVAIAARRHLHELRIEVGSADDFANPPRIIDADGYAAVARGDNSWREVQAELGCCRDELEELAATLVGERILPGHPDDRLVQFWMNEDANRSTALCARNAMTAETAFGVLHLLEHLRDVCVETHALSRFGDAPDCRLNPTMVRLLKPYRLHVGMFDQEFPLETMDRLAAYLDYLKIRELWWARLDQGGVELVLDFAMHARRHCRRLVLDTELTSDFDAVLEYFQHGVPRLGPGVVAELLISRFISYPVDARYWPAALPPKGRWRRPRRTERSPIACPAA